jgi:hypothetical protein
MCEGHVATQCAHVQVDCLSPFALLTWTNWCTSHSRWSVCQRTHRWAVDCAHTQAACGPCEPQNVCIMAEDGWMDCTRLAMQSEHRQAQRKAQAGRQAGRQAGSTVSGHSLASGI